MTEIITREAAIEQGLMFFFNGRKCVRGHLSERYVKNSACVACNKENTLKFRADNPEYARVQSSQWYKNNQDKVSLIKEAENKQARENAEQFSLLAPSPESMVLLDAEKSYGKQFETIQELFASLPKNRAEADRVGSVHFYTGKLCHRGHLSVRYTSGGNCVECVFAARGKFGYVRPRSVKNMERAKAALSSGNITYIAENPCKHGHHERFVGSNNCLECQKTRQQEDKIKNKHNRIARIYGLDKEKYEDLLNSQEGKCKICGFFEPEKFRLHVDHCHETKKVRGLLCGKCNQALGLFKHSTKLMAEAIKYIETEGQ